MWVHASTLFCILCVGSMSRLSVCVTFMLLRVQCVCVHVRSQPAAATVQSSIYVCSELVRQVYLHLHMLPLQGSPFGLVLQTQQWAQWCQTQTFQWWCVVSLHHVPAALCMCAQLLSVLPQLCSTGARDKAAVAFMFPSMSGGTRVHLRRCPDSG